MAQKVAKYLAYIFVAKNFQKSPNLVTLLIDTLGLIIQAG